MAEVTGAQETPQGRIGKAVETAKKIANKVRRASPKRDTSNRPDNPAVSTVADENQLATVRDELTSISGNKEALPSRKAAVEAAEEEPWRVAVIEKNQDFS